MELFARCKEIQIAESERFLLVESGIQLKQSGIRLTIGIQVPLTKTGIQYLESGIHGVESRIQECPRFRDSSETGTA